MTSMILPATNVELPGEWVLRKFHMRPSYSEGSINFKGLMVHKSSGEWGAIFNDGRGGESRFKWYLHGEDDFKPLWDKFVADCGLTEEELIQLFVEEMIQQQNFNNIIGTVVRTDDGDKIFRKSSEELYGEVQGKYWNRKIKNWVSLND